MMGRFLSLLTEASKRVRGTLSFLGKYISKVRPSLGDLKDVWREHRSLVLTVGGYTAFGLVLFLFFVYFTFPFQEIRGRVESYLEDVTSSGVEIQEIQPSLLPGLIFKGITVSQTQGDAVSVLTIDRLRLRIGLLPLLWMTHQWSGDAYLYGGRGWATVKQRKQALDIDMKIKGVRLENISYMENRWGIKMKGKLSGEFRLNGARNNSSQFKGRAFFRLDEGGIIESSVFGLFKLPSVSFDDAHGNIVISSGKGVLEEFKVAGNGVDLVLSGDIILQNVIGQSTINIRGRFRLSDPVASAFNTILPYMNLEKDAQGYYLFSITGTLSAPWFKN